MTTLSFSRKSVPNFSFSSLMISDNGSSRSGWEPKYRTACQRLQRHGAPLQANLPAALLLDPVRRHVDRVLHVTRQAPFRARQFMPKRSQEHIGFLEVAVGEG